MAGRISTLVSARRGAAVLAIVLAFTIAGTAAAAGFLLGTTNVSNATTTLQGSPTTTSPELRILNNGDGAALDLQVDTTRPALTINSAAKIANLNADKLDGVDSTGFVTPTTDNGRIVGRFRNAAPITTSISTPTAWPLNATVFTQQPGATMLFFVKLHWSSITACPAGTFSTGSVVNVTVDGAPAVPGLSTSFGGIASTGNTITTTFFVPAGTTAASHTLAATASSSSCVSTGGGTPPPVTTTFDQLQMDLAVLH